MSALDRAALRALVTRIAARAGDRGAGWSATARRSATSSSCGATSTVDVWVITWTNGNDTGFHDHDVSGGAVAVVEGEIIEERLVMGGAPRRLHHRRGGDVRLRRLARASHAPGQRLRPRSRSTPTRRRCGGWARTRSSRTARCAGSRSPTPRSCVPVSLGTCLLASSDLVVIGGGVMGRFTAYHAAEQGARVVVLERGRVGDPMTASYGRTRIVPQRLPRQRATPGSPTRRSGCGASSRRRPAPRCSSAAAA